MGLIKVHRVQSNPLHAQGLLARYLSYLEGPKKGQLLSTFESFSQEHPETKEWEKISAKGEIILSYYID